ncbi:hypothetical protein SLS62_010544 [Diatrype stigma]|uniref:Copper transport protein n=1 Tax=Diatrype stigma TaxID=117547 RepID=A0AAN9UBA0_9PEZI
MALPRHDDSMMTMNMDDMDMDMSGDSNSSSSSSSSSSMHMGLFQTDMSTPLYSAAWTPTTSGAYAGTILFLILLGVVLRVLIAAKALAEARWLDRELQRRYVIVDGKPPLPLSKTTSQEDSSSGGGGGGGNLGKRATLLTEDGVEEDVVVLQKKRPHHHRGVRPWRLSVDPVRALLDTCLAGVGYLL